MSGERPSFHATRLTAAMGFVLLAAVAVPSRASAQDEPLPPGDTAAAPDAVAEAAAGDDSDAAADTAADAGDADAAADRSV